MPVSVLIRCAVSFFRTQAVYVLVQSLPMSFFRTQAVYVFVQSLPMADVHQDAQWQEEMEKMQVGLSVQQEDVKKEVGWRGREERREEETDRV